MYREISSAVCSEVIVTFFFWMRISARNLIVLKSLA